MISKAQGLSLLIAGAAMGAMGSAHASLEPMGDAELSAVHGGLALIPGILNVGPLLNAPFVAFNLFGAVSLASGINIAAISAGSGLNLGGLAGLSLANTLGISGLTGISLPLGMAGAAGVALPGSLNGLGVLNVL